MDSEKKHFFVWQKVFKFSSSMNRKDIFVPIKIVYHQPTAKCILNQGRDCTAPELSLFNSNILTTDTIAEEKKRSP